MEAWRKPAVWRALLVLLIVASIAGAAVSTAYDEKCWKDDDHHPICITADCKETCLDHGHVDGRCKWSWRPYCQCLVAGCQ